MQCNRYDTRSVSGVTTFDTKNSYLNHRNCCRVFCKYVIDTFVLTYIYRYRYAYLYMYVCVCVCMNMSVYFKSSNSHFHPSHDFLSSPPCHEMKYYYGLLSLSVCLLFAPFESSCNALYFGIHTGTASGAFLGTTVFTIVVNVWATTMQAEIDDRKPIIAPLAFGCIIWMVCHSPCPELFPSSSCLRVLCLAAGVLDIWLCAWSHAVDPHSVRPENRFPSIFLPIFFPKSTGVFILLGYSCLHVLRSTFLFIDVDVESPLSCAATNQASTSTNRPARLPLLLGFPTVLLLRGAARGYS